MTTKNDEISQNNLKDMYKYVWRHLLNGSEGKFKRLDKMVGKYYILRQETLGL